MNTPRFLKVSEVISLNKMQTAEFGGLHLVRDEGLLEAAVAMPMQGFGGVYLHPTLYLMAAAYCYHLALNHPFVDGNKRTSLAAADAFLGLNGLDLLDSVSHPDIVISVVQGAMSKNEVAKYFIKHTVSIGIPGA